MERSFNVISGLRAPLPVPLEVEAVTRRVCEFMLFIHPEKKTRQIIIHIHITYIHIFLQYIYIYTYHESHLETTLVAFELALFQMQLLGHILEPPDPRIHIILQCCIKLRSLPYN